MSLVRREFAKLLFQKRTYFGWVIFFLVPFVVSLAVYFGEGSGDSLDFSDTDRATAFFINRLISTNGLYVSVGSLALLGAFLLPMFAAMAGSQAIAGEAEKGTLRSVLMQPVNRGALLIAKWVVANAYLAIALLLLLVGSLIAGAAFFGIKGMTLLYGGGTVGLGHSFGIVFQCYGFIFFGMMAVVSLALLLSALTNSALAAMAGGLGLVTVMIVLGNLPQLDFLAPYLFTAHFNTLISYLMSPMNWETIREALLNFGVWTVLTTTAAWLVFRSKDIRS